MQSLNVRCFFAKRGCKHNDDLFKAAYQRVNRARGTKILRCFPHCCPTHIPRSYCGSTLELRVDAAAPTAAGISVDQLVVYARFRQRDNDAELRVGDVLQLHTITKNLQSPANTKAPWIQSRVCNDKKDTGETFSFEINPGRRWYYTWHSSKNTAKRATKHVLEAFVFVRHPHDDTLRCVATIVSPSFTLVSFRRVTASETLRLGEELKELSLPRSPTTTRPLTVSPMGLSVKLEAGGVMPPRRLMTFIDSTNSPDPLEMLFTVAKQFPLGDTKSLIPKWIALAEQEQKNDQARRRSLAGLSLKDEAQVAAHVVWWLMLDDETHQAWADHTRRGSDVLLDTIALRACYDKWTRWLVSHVECFLAALEQPPLHELAASLARAGYSYSYQSLASSHCFGWRGFVAQAREIVVNVSKPASQTLARFRDSAPWFCPLERVSVASFEDKQWCKPYPGQDQSYSMRRLPVTVLFAYWQQLCCLNIDLNTDCSPNELTISSARSANDQVSRPTTKLLLDNRHRQFNAMPHGESTMIQPVAGFFGDYVASQRRDGTVEIDLFTWNCETDNHRTQLSAQRWRWTFRRDELEMNRLEVNLSVSVADLKSRGYLSEGTSDLNAWSIQEKMSTVVGWREVYKVHIPYTRRQSTN